MVPDWLAHQTYDDYWNEIDTSDKYSKIDAPAFIDAAGSTPTPTARSDCGTA